MKFPRPFSRPNDFLLTAEELRIQKRKRRLWLIGAVGVFIFALFGFFLNRPARHAVRSWQARRHAGKAFRFIDEEKWTEARNEAVAALQLESEEPEAIRAVARFLSRTRQPEALEFWKKLAGEKTLTREDERDEVSAAIGAGNSGVAESALNDLLTNRTGGPTAADWLLAAQVFAQKNEPAQEAGALEKVVVDPKATERELLQASLLQINLRAPNGTEETRKKRDAAWARLTKLAESKSAAGLDALVILAQRALSLPNDARAQAGDASKGELRAVQLADTLENHPLAKAPQKLLAIDLRIHASPNEQRTLLEAAIEKWKGADNESVAALAKWVNSRGEFQSELDAISLERALQSKDLFLQHVDALGALGRWEEIRRLLESDRFPLEAMVEQMYLARCYAQLGEKTASENSWQRALEAAGGDPQKLMTVADYAEKNGAVAIASRAYDQVITAAAKSRPAWQGKLRLAYAAQNTQAVHETLAGMLRIWPNDLAIANDEAYTRALQLPNDGSRDEDLRSIQKLAEDLVAREPRSLPHRTLLALSLLKLLHPNAALEVYRNINIAPEALSASALAVHSAVLAATGNRDGASAEASKIPQGALLPEERALVSDLGSR